MKFKKILSLILSVSMLSGFSIASYAEEEPTILLAGSDFQSNSGPSTAKTNMTKRFNQAVSNGITKADGLLFAGDYDNRSSAYTQTGINTIKGIVKSVVTENMVFAQGAMDDATYTAKSGNNDPASGAYGVYVINADDFGNDDTNENLIKRTAQNLIDYLNEKLAQEWKKPIFIVSHNSLHYSMQTKLEGDAIHSKYIFDALNAGGQKGLNIFFLFGKNHLEAWDDYLGGACIFLKKGDSILIPDHSQTAFSSQTLAFSYLTAGYTGGYVDRNSGADGYMSVTSYKITDTQVELKRYSGSGVYNMKSKGVKNSYKGESGYSPNTTVYTSPQTVTLTSVSDKTPIENLIDPLPEYNFSTIAKQKIPVDGEKLRLVTGTTFSAVDTAQDVIGKDHEYYNADYVLSFDAAVNPANLALAAYYEGQASEDWTLMPLSLVSEETIPANTEIRVMDLYNKATSGTSATVSYKDMVTNYANFKLALVAYPDSPTLTVGVNAELKLFETELANDVYTETKNSYVVGETQELVYDHIGSTLVLKPTVLINAGTQSGYTPKYTYTNNCTFMNTGNYNNPNNSVTAGNFMKWNLPELPEGYELKKAVLLGSPYYTDQLYATSQKGSSFIYHLTEDIDSSYTYYTDTEAHPDKNLAKIVPTGNNAWAFKGAYAYKANTNYTENVTDNSYYYSLSMDVTDYIESLYGANYKAVTQSMLLISNQMLSFRAKDMDHGPIVLYMEVGEKLDADFVSKAYAHEGDGFGLALNVNTDKASEVTFNVEGTEYPASLYNDNWVAYVPGIAKSGTYTIAATVKDTESRTAEKTQSFVVYDKATILGSTYCMKYQSSNSKMWEVSDANNYDLLYSDSTVKDCLYSIIDISSITNPDLIESAYFVTSTGYNGTGGDQYTKFVIEECAEFATNFFTGGQKPSAFPEIITTAAEGAYTSTVVNAGNIDYNLLTSEVPVKANAQSRFIKLNATEYIKAKVTDGAPRLHLRTSVRNANDGNYARANNNAEVKLYIKYKDSEVIDNYDGTTSYVVDARNYGENTVLSIAAKLNGEYFDSVESCNTAKRVLYRFTDGEANPSILVWNNIIDIVPMRAPIIVK